MHLQTKPAKHTPFRDRQFHISNEGVSGQKSRDFRFVNNENQDNSNPLIQIKRKSRPSETCEFECREDYNNGRTSEDEKEETKRSTNLNSRGRSNSQESALKLTQSQEVLFKRSDRNLPMNCSLTFASIKQGALKNSLQNQEYQEDKKIKNEILEEIIRKASQKNLKSQELARKSQRGEPGVLCCANKDGKKAKYRIVSESDSEEELYYCSKCSILLLQQGFTVVEIAPTKKGEGSRRRKDCEVLLSKVVDFQGRLKYHMNQLEDDQSTMFDEARTRTEETYDIILFIVEQMKARDLEAMNQSQDKVQKTAMQVVAQKRKELTKLSDRFRQLELARKDLSELVEQGTSNISEQELTGVLSSYTDTLANFERYEPLTFQLQEETLEEKLERLINEVNEHYTARREHFSFQSQPESSASEAVMESTKKAFRGLFMEDEPQNTRPHKKHPRYYNGELIQEEDENFSPNFKKHY